MVNPQSQGGKTALRWSMRRSAGGCYAANRLWDGRRKVAVLVGQNSPSGQKKVLKPAIGFDPAKLLRIPSVSEIVEIGYLYVVSSLVQPVYRGVRTDQTLAACTTGQLG